MTYEIKCLHLAFLLHPLVIEHAVVLTAIAARSVQEDYLLRRIASSFVEDLRTAPERGVDVDVAANRVIVVQFQAVYLP